MPADMLALTVVPIQNPWGYEHFTRQNARGVDLNRNFDSGWREYEWDEDVLVPWDYAYKGPEPASEPETKVIQAIIDRERPLCVVDFHTADYSVDCAHGTDRQFCEAVQRSFGVRLRDRYICQFHAGGYGGYRQVKPGPLEPEPPCGDPWLIQYASDSGARASFLVEMSGDRDDVHALVMNTDVTVEMCLAAVEQCLRRYLGWHRD
ncbi:MAG: M14 family metallopeptidase [Anaerolineae bacterium]